MISFEGKRVLVLGLGSSGLAVAEAGAALGAQVFAHDSKLEAAEADEGFRAAVETAESFGARMLNVEEVALGEFEMCVISPGIPPGTEIVQTLIRRDVPVISEVELAHAIARAPIAAVTGTNGKSTTTVLAGKMLEASGFRVLIGGNLSAEGYDLPLVKAALQAEPGDVIVAEVSSFQLERSFEFHPKAAALLNVTSDHANRHATLGEYASAKMRLFQAQSQEDWAVLGQDSPLVRSLAPQIRSRKLWFSAEGEVQQGAFLRGGELMLRFENTESKIALTGELRLWASFDRLNVLAASCIARAMGASIDGIRAAARQFSGLPHRMQLAARIAGVSWLNNSMCTNPAAGIAAACAVAERGPLILIAGGVGKNSDYSEWAQAVASAARTVILIGRDAPMLAQMLESAGATDVTDAGTLEAAMERARVIAEPGDSVLLAPAMASFDQFESFRERGRRFIEIAAAFEREGDK